MPRFDNFAHQLQKLTFAASVASIFAIESDAMLIVGQSQNPSIATLDKDVSARTTFFVLSGPQSLLIAASTPRDSVPFPFGNATHRVNFGVASWQVSGTTAKTDHMQGAKQISSQTSIIDNTTSIGPVIVLPLGSTHIVSSVSNLANYANNFTSTNEIMTQAAYITEAAASGAAGGTHAVLHSLVL